MFYESRRSEFRASKVMVDRVLNNPKITILYDTVIDELSGDNILQSIVCRNINTGNQFIMEVNGLFYGLGLTPNSIIFKNQIDIDSDGYI